ncbi:MAG TPA: ATPase, T2SS/T4P/T4SS family, partial [Verrucomicrobiota bacterium]|nr:ATPase, T2SS/T4P/T4SS family [Verrucomicrobiota bacterium]
METFYKILQTAVEGMASDIHLKVDGPVIFRINRQLVAIQAPTPNEEWINKIVDTIVPRHARVRLDTDREVDFSYHLPGVGRFRTNVYQQKGQWCLSMRHVKTIVPNFEELNLPPILKSFAEIPRGIILVSGTTGCGKSTTLA